MARAAAAFQIETGRGFYFKKRLARIIPEDDRWTNTPVGAFVNRDGHPALRLYVVDNIIDISKLSC